MGLVSRTCFAQLYWQRKRVSKQVSMSAQRSIVICGGSFAGLALALALRQGLGAEVAVIVADPALGVRPSRDRRATAIVAACRRLFETLGVWGDIASTAQPILDMVVTDSKLEDATRPVFLTFAGDVEPGRAVRAHGRESPPDRCAGDARQGAWHRPARDRGDFVRRACGRHRRDAGRWQRRRCQSAGRSRWRALKAARARRHRDPWLGLRPVRHCRHGRP